ncbi:MAG TPA: adenylate/guanylate cyclase domain-containing protein [Burkholderiales bacterium]|nr:adenylate/guanylate cyclase domain-containing protein [Burkholderiales bacterium]
MAATALKEQKAPAAQRRPAVLLYAELRNFTRMSEVLEPAKVLALASEFFAFAARSVAAHQGRMLSMNNDALLAAFGGAGKALEAAQEMQREFAPIGERWQNEYGLPAAVAHGIHAGETVFGMAGPQGAEQFVAFGDSVSVAERLVHRARAGEIILSSDAYKALGGGVDAQELPPLEIGNRRPALRIFGVVLETRLDFT